MKGIQLAPRHTVTPEEIEASSLAVRRTIEDEILAAKRRISDLRRHRKRAKRAYRQARGSMWSRVWEWVRGGLGALSDRDGGE